ARDRRQLMPLGCDTCRFDVVPVEPPMLAVEVHEMQLGGGEDLDHGGRRERQVNAADRPAAGRRILDGVREFHRLSLLLDVSLAEPIARQKTIFMGAYDP